MTTARALLQSPEDETAARVPPHDDECERGLLGAFLIDAATATAACKAQYVTETDIYNPAHRVLFHTLSMMQTAGAPVDDLNAVVSKLRERGELEQVGGESYLIQLMDGCPTAQHAGYYAQQIRKASACRLAIEHARGIADLAYDGSATELLSACEKSVTELRAATSVVESEGDPFPSITLPDLEAYQPKPEDNHIAGRGWLRRGAMTLLTGGTGLGKSVLVEQIAVCIASGMPILGCIPVAKPFRVLLLQAENDMESLQRDILAIRAAISADRELVAANLTIRWAYAVSGKEFVKYFVAQLAAGWDFTIIDNYQAFSGAADINDSGAWDAWFSPIRAAFSAANAAVLLVDHTTKPKVDPRNGSGPTARESVYSAAGTSRKANGARCSAELSECRDDETCRRFRLRFGKNAERNGLVDANGRVVRDLFIEHSDSAEHPYWRASDIQSPTDATGKYDQQIAAMLIEDPHLSNRKIAEKVGCNHSVVSRCRDRLEI